MRVLRGILTRLRGRIARRRVMRTGTGNFRVELYHGKEPITGNVTFTWTEVTPEEDQ